MKIVHVIIISLDYNDEQYKEFNGKPFSDSFSIVESVFGMFFKLAYYTNRLEMWLGNCPNGLLTSYATGSVGLIGDRYQYNTVSCVQSMQITSSTSLPSDCRQPWK